MDQELASGIYLAKLAAAGEFLAVAEKLVLIK